MSPFQFPPDAVYPFPAHSYAFHFVVHPGPVSTSHYNKHLSIAILCKRRGPAGIVQARTRTGIFQTGPCPFPRKEVDAYNLPPPHRARDGYRCRRIIPGHRNFLFHQNFYHLLKETLRDKGIYVSKAAEKINKEEKDNSITTAKPGANDESSIAGM